MFIQTAKRQRVELVPLDAEITAEAGMFAIRAKGIDDPVGRLTRAAGAFFGLRAAGKVVSPERAQKEPALGVFKEKHSGLLRIVHKEAVIRFRPGVTDKQRRQILAKHSLEIRSKNRFVDNQFVIIDKKGARTGVELNVGPEVWIVAPSSGGKQGIFTTDVSLPNRGFNLGTGAAGGADGLHTNSFGGTSSATPLTAGVGALVLSVKPSFKRDELKHLLAETADKIGSDHDPATGHSPRFGFGRVNAEAAVRAAMQ